MSSRIKRGVVLQYEEVESDIDMSDNEREMSREQEENNSSVTKNLEIKLVTGESSDEGYWDPRPKKKKQKKRVSKKKVKEEVIVELESKLSLLPIQNLDLITEIFTRLDLGTLLNIAELNKEFHHLLVKTANGISIFRSVRTKLELPLLKGMSEIHFASLGFNGTTWNGVSPYAKNRVRLCPACLEADHIDDGRAYLGELEDIHPRSSELTPHFIFSGGSQRINITVIINCKKLFVDKTLESVSEQLFAVEAKVRKAHQSSGRPSRGSRVSIPGDSQIMTEALDEFIKEHKKPFLKIQKESRSLLAIMDSQQAAKSKLIQNEIEERRKVSENERQDFELRHTERREAVEARAIESGICTAAEIDTWGEIWENSFYRINLNLPVDDQEWKRLQPWLRKMINSCQVEEEAKELLQRQAERKREMKKTQYIDYRDQRKIDFTNSGIWTPDDVDIEEAFEEAEEKIDKELMECRYKFKKQVILSIYNSNIRYKADYIKILPLPLDSYDDEFFNRFTSQFTQWIWDDAIDSSPLYNHQRYLEILSNRNQTHENQNSLNPYKDIINASRHGIIMRQILKAVKLDINASMNEIKDLNLKGKFIFGMNKKALRKPGLDKVNYHSAEILVWKLNKKNWDKPNFDLPLIQFVLNDKIPA